MVRKRGARGFLALIVATMLLFSVTPGVIAPSHPDFGDGGTDAGDATYTFERIYEQFQVFLAARGEDELSLKISQAEERYAEMHQLILEGNYEAAEEAARDAESIMSSSKEDMDVLFREFAATQIQEEDLQLLGEIQKDLWVAEQHVEDLNTELEEQVAAGAIDEETAEELTLGIAEATEGVQAASFEETEDYIENVAIGSGISEIEAEVLVSEGQDAVAEETYKKEVTEENIEELREQIEELEIKATELEQAGSTEESAAVDALVENAKISILRCYDAIDAGFYGKAYGQLSAAEHLILNAEKVAGGDSLSFVPSEERISREREESGEYLRDWEKFKEEMISKYPEKKEYFEQRAAQAQKVLELSDKLAPVLSAEFDKLKAEGKSEEEASAEVSKIFAEEFQNAYGKAYVPPNFANPEKVGDEDDLEVIPIGRVRIGADGNIEGWVDGWEDGAGGFVEGVDYKDAASGYTYRFKDDSYTYTTKAGVNYEVKYPAGYDPNAYSHGDEVHEYEIDTPEGKYNYEYSSTGYKVVKPDGTTEEFAYPQGTYEVVGGGSIEQKPNRFEYKSEDGTQTVIYDYNPEYEHYVASDGKVFVTDVSTHVDNTQYNSGEGEYSYSYGGETWTYERSTDIWTSSSGQTYKPSATTGAPVGHEDDGSFTTEHGETWTYDSSSGTWKSSSGQEYTPPPSSYYYYDSSTNTYTDSSGHTYSSEQSDPSGKTWTYNEGTNTWTSSTGETYDSSTGQTSGGTTEYSSGGYHTSGGTYTDNYGNTYSYDSSTGSWSYSGEGQPSYSGTYSGSYEGYSGSYSDGSYSGGDSGSYSGSEGGSYSGGDGGSYSSGYVIAETETLTRENFLTRLFKRLFGLG